MSLLAPPPAPPRVTTGGGDGSHKFRLRLTAVTAAMLTLLGTAWACTLGPIPAIVALMIAKHILVAILVMGLGVDEPLQKDEG